MSEIAFIWLASLLSAGIVLIIAVRREGWQKIGTELAAAVLIASFPFLFAAGMPWLALVLGCVVHIWMGLLPARLLFGRQDQAFLRASTQVNALGGMLGACVVAALAVWASPWLVGVGVTVGLSMTVALLLAFLGTLLWNMRHYRFHADATKMSIGDLPSVSVCIPARNEDHALTECLQAVLASDYLKLEVLVLDDCSQDKTSSIIRSFAHDGVRFLQGDVPATGWLGKNQAMKTLAAQASGKFVLFLSVDTHVAPQSISRLVDYTLQHGLEMASVLPQNRLGLSAGTLLPTLQYFWRIIWPVTNKRVPVSSKCWIMSTDSLRRLGGFESASRKVVPEESFARRLFNTNAYRFLVSDPVIGMTTAKKWHSQVETSLRLLYPSAGRQPFVALGRIAAIIGMFVAPFGVAIYMILTDPLAPLAFLAYVACALVVLNYYLVLYRTQPKSWILAGLFWPFIALQEAVLLTTSMLMYEFGEVNWKGRNVCYPVLGLVGRPHQGPHQIPSAANQKE